MLTLYRAVRSMEMQQDNPYQITRRVPCNVPYLVDNIWEWLRPEGLPSRRHCAYASPTPELALACAGATTAQRNEFIVTTVTFPGRVAIVQVPLKDAKYHPDVKKLPKVILNFLGMAWRDKAVADRLDLAPLFLPVVSKKEIEQVLHSIEGNDELRETITNTSRFWQDAKLLTPSDERLDDPEGEIFFEAFDGYRLSRSIETENI